MTPTEAITITEEFLDALSRASEPECGAPHGEEFPDHPLGACSHHVTHATGRACQPGYELLCDVAAAWVTACMDDPEILHNSCGRRVGDCWTLYPV